MFYPACRRPWYDTKQYVVLAHAGMLPVGGGAKPAGRPEEVSGCREEGGPPGCAGAAAYLFWCLCKCAFGRLRLGVTKAFDTAAPRPSCCKLRGEPAAVTVWWTAVAADPASVQCIQMSAS